MSNSFDVFVNRRSRSAPAAALVAVLVLAWASGSRAARAADPDAGAPDASTPETASPPRGHEGETPAAARAYQGEASAATPGGDATETGSGLFEQSASAAAAKDQAKDQGISGAQPPAPFTLTGYVRGDAFIGKVPDYRAAEMKAGYGELSLALKTAKGSNGDGFAEMRVRQGLQGQQQGTSLDLREAYANAYLGPVDLRIGRQIIVWGRADALNPTNNLTPFDLRIRSPIEDDRRIGNLGARMFARLAPLRIEGVWMPLYAASELPPVGLPPFVTLAAPRFPPPELKYGLLAGRVHLELPAFEMSVSYLRGHAPLPGLTLSGLTFDPVSPEVRVARTAYEHQVVGLDFSTAIRDLLAIRAEIAYRRPADYRNRIHAPRPDLQYVLGVDRAFGPVTVIGQYLGRYVFDWAAQRGPDQPLDPFTLMGTRTDFLENAATLVINQQLARTNQILFSQTARLQHIATMRVEWLTAHDTLSIAALGLMNLTTREWMAAPKVGYKLSDALTAYLGGEIFMGPNGTLFGLIDEILSAGYAELRVIF